MHKLLTVSTHSEGSRIQITESNLAKLETVKCGVA